MEEAFPILVGEPTYQWHSILELGVPHGRRPASNDTRLEEAMHVATLAMPSDVTTTRQEPTTQHMVESTGSASQLVSLPLPRGERTSLSIFAIDERLETTRMSLEKYAMRIARTCSLWHFTRNGIAPYARAMLRAIGIDRPKLL